VTTYAILGGGGAFAIHTALYLLGQGAEQVIGIGRAPLRPEPFTLNVEKNPRFEYHVCHVTRDHDSLTQLLGEKKPAVIINFAAQGEGAASWDQSWRFFETNCVGLSRLVEALRERSWLKRFIHIGTSEVYGSVDGRAVNEHERPNPTSPYAASKLAFDHYLMAVRKHFGFPLNILRPSNAYCPGQLLHRIIPRAIVSGLSGVKFPLQGGGRATKSYIHARDLARAIHMVSATAQLGALYNVGPTAPIAIRDLVATCANALNLKLDDLCYPTLGRNGEDACYWLDSARIRQEIGWEPQISLDDGLAEMVAWGRQYLDQLRDWPTDYVLRA
jgi:dTDP-glucose 4,6-dehydratase